MLERITLNVPLGPLKMYPRRTQLCLPKGNLEALHDNQLERKAVPETQFKASH